MGAILSRFQNRDPLHTSELTLVEHKGKLDQVILSTETSKSLFILCYENTRESLLDSDQSENHFSRNLRFRAIVTIIYRPLHGPLARYVKLRIAHAPGMPGTISPPSRVSDPDMHHGTCRTHVSWCLPGLAVFFEVGGGGNVPGIPGACATHNFTYLVRSPFVDTRYIISVSFFKHLWTRRYCIVYQTSLC